MGIFDGWNDLFSDPEKLKRFGDMMGSAGAGAFTGGMRGGGWRGSLAGFLGGMDKGAQSYDQSQLNQAQAKIARMKASMPASAQLPDAVLKGLIDAAKIPKGIGAWIKAQQQAPGGAPGAVLPPGGPGQPAPPGGAPGAPAGPPGGGSGDPRVERFRQVAASGKVPRDQIIAEMVRLGLNPALLGGYGDRGPAPF